MYNQNVAVGDLNGDGLKEILFPSYDGRLHAYWLDKTQHGAWPYFPVGEANGGLGAPTVVNIYGDAELEVVIGTIASGVVAYDLPNTNAATARMLWVTSRGGLLRNGAVVAPSRPFTPKAFVFLPEVRR